MAHELPKFVRKFENIYELKGNVLTSTDLEGVPTGFTDLYVACNIFHIHSDLSRNFRGKNLAIFANHVKVHKFCTLDLSGEPTAAHSFQYNGGQNADGTGRDGQDGLTGKSGGNFALDCKFIDNGSPLTLISNGSDGTNGQDGSDGRDGEHGKDATRSSFVKQGLDWGMKTTVGDKWEMNSKFGLENSDKSTITTDDGLTAYVFKQMSLFEDWGIMLVKGGSGHSGKPGGRGGCGGKGGYAGSIYIKCCQSSQPNNVRAIANSGNDGKNGNGGLNGLQGRDGRDLWKYDQRNYAHPECFGEDNLKKFELIWGDNVSYSIWDGTRNQYVRVVKDRDIVAPTAKNRNDALKQACILYPERVSSFNFDALKNDFSCLLEDMSCNCKEEMEKSNLQSVRNSAINIVISAI